MPDHDFMILSNMTLNTSLSFCTLLDVICDFEKEIKIHVMRINSQLQEKPTLVMLW